MPSITKGQFKSPLLPLAVAGIIVGVAIRTAGLATSLTLYYQFFPQFIQILQQVAQTILFVQGQINSLASSGTLKVHVRAASQWRITTCLVILT